MQINSYNPKLMFKEAHEKAFTENKKSASKSKGKRPYQQIELWKRIELIDCVFQRRETMKDCAKRLNINYCTAKHILKVYRKTGSYETDLMRKKKVKSEELKFRVLNDSQFAEYAINQLGYLPTKPEVHHSDQASTNNGSKHEDSVGENTHNFLVESKTDQMLPQNIIGETENLNLLDPNFLFENVSCEFRLQREDMKLKGV
jgi:hypothetical protein